jgi:archaellum component FlaC
MKLYLNEVQRSHLLEIFKASEQNAINGKDMELAVSFKELYNKIKPENAVYVELKRADAESIVEFCDIINNSLDKAFSFLQKDTERSKEEVEELKERVLSAKSEIESVTNQLLEKIRKNPV